MSSHDLRGVMGMTYGDLQVEVAQPAIIFHVFLLNPQSHGFSLWLYFKPKTSLSNLRGTAPHNVSFPLSIYQLNGGVPGACMNDCITTIDTRTGAAAWSFANSGPNTKARFPSPVFRTCCGWNGESLARENKERLVSFGNVSPFQHKHNTFIIPITAGSENGCQNRA